MLRDWQEAETGDSRGYSCRYKLGNDIITGCGTAKEALEEDKSRKKPIKRLLPTRVSGRTG